MNVYKHQLVVHVTSTTRCGSRQMQDKLLTWLASKGPTPKDGMIIEAVGVITKKRPNQVGGKIDLRTSDEEG